ncbi:MAG: RNA-binding protein [Alphaproteobacteria bacterium]|nr:RNA-binding protein [Alphaproteobacteria bacterium]
MKIMVLGLSKALTHHELLDLFKPFGHVQSCTLVMDKVAGTSKGFGFIEMPNEQEALAAIAALNKTRVAGGRIRVKRAEETDKE